MKRLCMFLVPMVALGAFVGLPAEASAEVIPVDLNLVPADETNRVDMTLTALVSGYKASDSDTSTITGNMTVELEIYFDPATHDVVDVNTIAFTGGRLYFSDVSFTLNFSLLGRIEASGTGIAAVPRSPLGPGPVEEGNFNTSDHVLVVDQGLFSAYGTSIIGGLFDPITIDLAVEPMEASSHAIGTIAVSLDAVQDSEGAYSVVLNLPVQFDEIVFENEVATISVQSVGVVEAAGSFTRCTLRTDLAGDDCRVDALDLAAFCEQWLSYSDLAACPLSADLAYDDCYVDFADFAVLAADWLKPKAQ
ncbi:MAG: hypothetical protein KAY65_01535 [Planctomycetes bacterium]|nr:hypothetical protein [Planctomycetota bacterium]